VDEITTLRELRPAPTAADLEAMRRAARQRFAAGTRSDRARRGRRPVLAGGLAAAAAASAATVLVLTSGSAVPGRQATGHAGTVVTTAWTVREDADGTVTIYLREYANPAGLQQALRADGINAIVRPVPVALQSVGLAGALPGSQGKNKQPLRVPRPTCMYATANDAPAAVQSAVVTLAARDLPAARFVIHPTEMPQGSALLLPFMTGFPESVKNGNTGILALIPAVLNNDTVPACVPVTKKVPDSAPPSAK
jgi:hypothetical protein